jgi:hypothetical protein
MQRRPPGNSRPASLDQPFRLALLREQLSLLPSLLRNTTTRRQALGAPKVRP